MLLFPKSLNDEASDTESSFFDSSILILPSQITERIETIPKTKNTNFQSPNFAAKIKYYPFLVPLLVNSKLIQFFYFYDAI